MPRRYANVRDDGPGDDRFAIRVRIFDSDMTLDASGTPWVAYRDHEGLVRVAYVDPGGWTPSQANWRRIAGIENVNIVMPPGAGRSHLL